MPFAVTAMSADATAAVAAQWLGEAASTLIADELTALGYSALPREDRVSVFDRLRLPMSSELTRATIIRVAELIGATEVVFGEVTLGDSLAVAARTISLGTGRLLPDVREQAAREELFDVFGRVAAGIGRGIGQPPGAPGPPLPRMPLPAFENYIKGLMAAGPTAQQRFLESAMTQAPRDGRVLTALWSVYADQGLHDKALAVASAVPAEASQLRRARFDVALSLIELQRFDGAERELAALHEQQRAAAVSNALGVVALRRGTLPDAAAQAAPLFERAANEAPEDADYLFNLGYARGLSGDSAGALLWLREVVRHNAADGDAHLVMGALLGAGGRAAESRRELDLARLLGTSLEVVPPSVSRVPGSLERVRARLDDVTLPSASLSAPQARDQRETAAFHLSQGRMLAEDGRDREAIVQLRRSVYLAPYEDEPHLILGRLYERAGRLNEAIDELKVAIWCRESAAAHLALGRVLLATGDRDAAREALQRALKLDPGSAEIQEWLRKIGG